MRLNLDTSEVVQYADKLEQMSKRALPRAVKETLSKAALDVKKRTMPKTSKQEFTIRRSNFFKANSTVEFAKMGKISSMKAVVGFFEGKLGGGDNNFAVRDLEQQEYGGKIGGRKFIPLDSARIGKNRSRNVKRSIESVKEIDNVFKASRKTFSGARIKSKKQRWIRAAIAAKKKHGNAAYVLGNVKNGRQTLSKIDQISTNRTTRKIEIKRTAVYSYKKGGIKPVKGRGFMKRASYESSLNMNDIFINEARKQIEYLKNR